MIVFVDNENRIKAVNTTSDSSLTALEINDDANPFNGWSTAKICCYKVAVLNGFVIMMTPYIDSRSIEAFNTTGKQVDANTEGVANATDGLFDIAESVSNDSDGLFELAEMIADLDARVTALEEKEDK